MVIYTFWLRKGLSPTQIWGKSLVILHLNVMKVEFSFKEIWCNPMPWSYVFCCQKIWCNYTNRLLPICSNQKLLLLVAVICCRVIGLFYSNFFFYSSQNSFSATQMLGVYWTLYNSTFSWSWTLYNSNFNWNRLQGKVKYVKQTTPMYI